MAKLSPPSQVNATVDDQICDAINRVCFFAAIDLEIRNWMFKLQDEGRLLIALKAFKAIDQQMQIGANVREAVGQVLREIRGDFGTIRGEMGMIVNDVKENMDKSVRAYLSDIEEKTKTAKTETEQFIQHTVETQVHHVIDKIELLLNQGKSIEDIQKALKDDTETFVKTLITDQIGLVVDKIETLLQQEKSIEQVQRELKEDTKAFVKEIVQEQVQILVEKVELLLKQGKSIDEIEQEIKTAVGELNNAAGGVQTIIQSLKIAPVKGEKAELELLHMINEAFLANHNVIIQPLGGPDATDIIVKFKYNDIEIGRVLIESKATQSWSNKHLEQTKNDMQRYDIATAILAVNRPPRGAKVKGYLIDDTLGLVIITTPEMAVATLAMFYDMYLANYRLGRKTMDLQAIMDNKDVLSHITDNLECLKDCKKIKDSIDKSHKTIHRHVKNIINRLQQNNEKIALIISKHGLNTS